MDINKGLAKLHETIEKKLEHADYKRVNELAKKYLALISGEGIEAYLQQFTRREDKDLFDQRVRLTQSITPAVAEAIMSPFYKVGRTNRVYQAIDTDNQGAKQEIQEAIAGFFGEGEQSGLDYYMQTRYTELVFSDPNAFIAIEFDPFDPKKEKAKPKPIEISCEQAINYEYKNGILQWLIARWEHEYKNDKGEKKKGERYVMYLADEAIVLEEIDATAKITELEVGSYEIYTIGKDKGTRIFTKQIFEPKSGQVPAFRVGYKRDLFTKGKTFVSPLHPALPYFMKTIKAVSELDISLALHTFPQKIQYVSACQGVEGMGCTGGKTRAGSTCKVCQGSGINPIHTSGQDIILLPLPKDKEQMINLEGLVAYKTPPIDLIKFQKEYIDSLKEDAVRAVFNGDQFVKATIAQTATQKELDMEAIYDTLSPFAKKYSSSWLMVVRLIAIYIEADSDSLELYHKFPADFKMRGQESLLAELQLANNSQAPAYVVDSITKDLLEIMYADDQDTLAKLKVKQKYYPFKGRTAQEIQLVLTGDLTTQFNKILYANFEEIWDRLEQKHGNKIYLMEDSKQKAEVKATVDEIQKEIEKAKAKALVPPGGFPGIEPGQDDPGGDDPGEDDPGEGDDN